MEHLFLPAGSKLDIVEYPGYSDYIGIPFLEYPKVHNKEIYLNAQAGFRGLVHARTHEVAEHEAPFFTTWLLCGLLQEVLRFVPERMGIEASYQHDMFVKPRSDICNTFEQTLSGHENYGNAEIFCTSELVNLLESWRTRVRNLQKEAKNSYEHLYTCMLTAHTVSSWPKMKTVLPGSIMKEIATIGSVLTNAIQSAFEDASWYDDVAQPPLAWLGYGWSENDVQRGVRNGWCPSEMSALDRNDMPILEALWFRSYMLRMPSTGMYMTCPTYQESLHSLMVRDHKKCSRNECFSHQQVNEPEARQPFCLCDTFKFKASEWEKLLCIVETDVALLKCQRSHSDSSWEVVVVPWEENLDFVAVSHVWADGSGNSKRNEILKCRFDHIVNAVFDSWKARCGQETNEVCLWFDTLCCPVAPQELRKKVLVSMRTIYTEARYVLVLDGELQNINSSGLTNLEIGVRIVTSNWMKRLWTLQEGWLAKEVWVRFQDKSFNLDSLKTMKHREVPLNQRLVANVFGLLLVSIRNQRVDQTSIGPELWTIFWAATHSRKVTVVADEAICFGVFMGLDVQRIVDASPIDRMQVFWNLVGASNFGIPRSIILDEGQKLQHPGYGWAPVSLLRESTRDTFLVDRKAGRLTEEGFVIHSKGFFLQRAHLLSPYTAQLDKEFLQTGESLRLPETGYIRDEDGRWYALQGLERTENKPPGPFLETLLPEQGVLYGVVQPRVDNRSVLVTVQHRDDQRAMVKTLYPILAVPDKSLWATIMELGHNMAYQLVLSSDFLGSNTADKKRQIYVAAGQAAASAVNGEHSGLLQVWTLQSLQGLIMTITTAMITNLHHTGGEAVPESYEWCFT